MVVLIQYTVILSTLYALMCLLIFQIESFLMVVSMTEDITYRLYSINEMAKAKTNRIEMEKTFIDIVQFHSSVKQLS